MAIQIMEEAKDFFTNEKESAVRYGSFFVALLLIIGAWKFAIEGLFED